MQGLRIEMMVTHLMVLLGPPYVPQTHAATRGVVREHHLVMRLTAPHRGHLGHHGAEHHECLATAPRRLVGLRCI